MFDNKKIIEALNALRQSDPELGEELETALETPLTEAVSAAVMPETPPLPQLTQETIVLRTGRPVLAVFRDEAQLTFNDADSEVWRARLTAAKPRLAGPLRAVGRIELEGHPFLDWVGTGWLVAPDIVITNRHVAREFARNSSAGFVFRSGISGRVMEASIDFLEEIDNPESRPFQLIKVLHIEPGDGPDLAFLQVRGEESADPIGLLETTATQNQQVAVIGYPARDSRIPEQDLMERIFGNVFNKKRLAPGQIKAASTLVTHDCSTLGGNSGSVVLDLASGKAVAIHFAGRFLEANFAVPADRIQDRLQQIERGETRRPAPVSGVGVRVQPQAAATQPDRPRIACTIPINVTIEVGQTVLQGGVGFSPVAVVPGPGAGPAEDFEEDELFEAEARPEDYLDRKGYEAEFLGGGIEVPLPRVTQACDQVLTFDFGGNSQESVLKYEHFSVVMNAQRRMCFFSAVNIDGRESRKKKRRGWRRDPRIAFDQQIIKECYGNPPKFSRGHMTRREDPVWGDDFTADRGNVDSMHVTNAVPQMQPFNAGIWLGLEDYALDHAREDDMKISVLTGPIFQDNDPVRFGVEIPRLFWKVIAFVHDQTVELSATGYSMSQEDFLVEEEFVFGSHKTFQRSLRWIENQTGLSFGALTEADRFTEEEALVRPLQDLRQIRFF